MATKKQNRPMKASVVRPGMKKPGSGPRETLPKIVTGKRAVEEYQKSISPKGMASASAAAKKALEDKYPGMFIPGTRTTSGINRAR